MLLMRLHAASGGPLSGGDRECLSISDMPRAKQGRVQGVVATPDLGGVAGGSSGSFTALGRFARRADGRYRCSLRRARPVPSRSGRRSGSFSQRPTARRWGADERSHGRGRRLMTARPRCVSASDPRHGRPVRVEVVGDCVSLRVRNSMRSDSRACSRCSVVIISGVTLGT
jgi:hypothetical protein